MSRLYTENEALRRKFFTEMYGFDWPGLSGSCSMIEHVENLHRLQEFSLQGRLQGLVL